jgi:NitT/TauT family transport system substrate-binding protein
MVGKKVRSLANITPSLYAILTKVGISPDKVSLVTNLPSDLALFEKGDVPVWGVYLTGLVVSAQQAGDKLNLIFPDDYGVHFYADTIFTTDEMVSAHPDLVLRFLRASLKGWVYAVENSNEVPGMILKINPSLDIKAENGKMTQSLPLINTGEDHIGWMKPDIWSGMESTLREQGVLNAPFDIRQVYDMQFLEQIYK